jgi:hypothetical protein
VSPRKILAAIPEFHERPDTFKEHGQPWAECQACGWQASANETNLPGGVDLETVTKGDGSCERFAARHEAAELRDHRRRFS